MSAVQNLSRDLNSLMNEEVFPVLKRYGIEHWEPSLVLRNPGKAGEWWVVSNDNLADISALLSAEAARRNAEDEQGDQPMLVNRSAPTA